MNRFTRRAACRPSARPVQNRVRAHKLHVPSPQTLAGFGKIAQRDYVMNRALTVWLGYDPAAQAPTSEDDFRSMRSRSGNEARARSLSNRALRAEISELSHEIAESSDTEITASDRKDLHEAVTLLLARYRSSAKVSREVLGTAQQSDQTNASTHTAVLADDDADPGEMFDSASFSRREHLAARTPAVVFTRTLTIAPGAPSLGACA